MFAIFTTCLAIVCRYLLMEKKHFLWKTINLHIYRFPNSRVSVHRGFRPYPSLAACGPAKHQNVFLPPRTLCLWHFPVRGDIVLGRNFVKTDLLNKAGSTSPNGNCLICSLSVWFVTGAKNGPRSRLGSVFGKLCATIIYEFIK